ncbi:hypothetical protein Trydic_g6585 [Trypoxylus dichotomus]
MVHSTSDKKLSNNRCTSQHPYPYPAQPNGERKKKERDTLRIFTALLKKLKFKFATDSCWLTFADRRSSSFIAFFDRCSIEDLSLKDLRRPCSRVLEKLRYYGVIFVIGCAMAFVSVPSCLIFCASLFICFVPTWISAEDHGLDSRQLFTFGRFGPSNSNFPPPRHDTPASSCNCKCGVPDDSPRIVNGTPVDTHDFPWMARLSYFNRFYCGGMLINDRYVLTAAHCVKGFMWFMIKVTFGELDRCDDKERPESRFVLRAVTGAFSFLNFDNDIALLRLNERVPITEKIKPICLPTKTDNLYVGVKATATGWGTLKEDGKPSCILQKVDVPVISNEECRMTNYTSKMISDNMMCAGYPKTGQKDSCQGDSGGPLIAARPNNQYELIGIVSWGNGCARPGYPGVYTRVTRYLDWILQNSRDGCFCKD